MAKIPITLTINGEPHEALVEPDRTLLDVLRTDLGLTGTKTNCLDAECGVCTVLVDGLAVNACLYLASDLSAYVTGVVLDVNGGLHIH